MVRGGWLHLRYPGFNKKATPALFVKWNDHFTAVNCDTETELFIKTTADQTRQWPVSTTLPKTDKTPFSNITTINHQSSSLGSIRSWFFASCSAVCIKPRRRHQSVLFFGLFFGACRNISANLTVCHTTWQTFSSGDVPIYRKVAWAPLPTLQTPTHRRTRNICYDLHI